MGKGAVAEGESWASSYIRGKIGLFARLVQIGQRGIESCDSRTP